MYEQSSGSNTGLIIDIALFPNSSVPSASTSRVATGNLSRRATLGVHDTYPTGGRECRPRADPGGPEPGSKCPRVQADGDACWFGRCGPSAMSQLHQLRVHQRSGVAEQHREQVHLHSQQATQDGQHHTGGDCIGRNASDLGALSFQWLWRPRPCHRRRVGCFRLAQAFVVVWQCVTQSTLRIFIQSARKSFLLNLLISSRSAYSSHLALPVK